MAKSSSWNRKCSFLRKYGRFPHSPFKTKWIENLKQKDAMEELKRGLVVSSRNPIRQQETSNADSLLSCLISSFRLHNCDPTPKAYSFLIKTLAKTSQRETIASVLDHLEKSENFETPESIFVDVIRVYGISGRIEEAIDVFSRVPNFRCVPSAYSLNALLSVLVRHTKGLKRVHEVLSKACGMGIRLDGSSFRILIGALCRIGEIDSAVDLIKYMCNDGYIVDPRLYSLLLSSLCKHKEGSSFDIIPFIESLRTTGFCPGLRDYANIMKFLIDGGRRKEALDAFTQMKYDRIEPDIVHYTIILKGVITDGDYVKADELFDELLVLGLVPDVYTYNVYIEGLCKKNDRKGALKVMSSMEELGCMPNVVTFNVLLKAMVKTGDVIEAKSLWNEMGKKGIERSKHTYEIMIDGFIGLDRVLEACCLLEEAFDKRLGIHSSKTDEVICRLCQKGLINKAMEFLVIMADKGVSPGLKVWAAMINCCGSNPKVELN